MIFLKIFFAILFFLLGVIYLYKADIVLSLNRIARELFFDDRVILLKRKKLAVLFFLLSFVAFYMVFSSFTAIITSQNEKTLLGLKTDHLLYVATRDYYGGKFQSSLEKLRAVVRVEPRNIDALKRIAYTYSALGNRMKAKEIWTRLSHMSPNDKEIQRNLREFVK